MGNLKHLVQVIAKLRSPEGCPWDRAQTLQSMRSYLIEETYEVLEAIGLSDDDPVRPALLTEELGDLLFNVLMLIQIASDAGDTSLQQVVARITDKMITRHPHVFGPDGQDAAGGSLEAWEAIKARRKTRKSRLDGIPQALPALLRAHRQGEKAGLVGFDWSHHDGVFAKMHEEEAELREALAGGSPERIASEYGDLLMATASLGRHIGASPEDALQDANARFRARFAEMEAIARQRGEDLAELDDEALDGLWETAKRALSTSRQT